MAVLEREIRHHASAVGLSRNMKPKVFVDGQAGTTGLVIHGILSKRSDIEASFLSEALRKDESARQDAIADADLAILCLPDDAARQAAQWARSASTRVIDTSTAHRTADGWVYGLPEMDCEVRRQIREADRVSNPGCYPTAVILLLRPLIELGVVLPDAPFLIHALSGYSGGGKALIARWTDPDSELLSLPFSAPYALEREHKHVPEMKRFSRMASAPQFLPRVGPFYNGMRVEIPLHASWLEGADSNADEVAGILRQIYASERFVEVRSSAGSSAIERELDPRGCNGTNRIKLLIYPNKLGHVLLVGILDNLAKGASGAAVQSMNIMLGFEEDAGLDSIVDTENFTAG